MEQPTHTGRSSGTDASSAATSSDDSASADEPLSPGVDEPARLPTEFAELDRIENGRAVFVFFHPAETTGLTALPATERVGRGTLPASDLPEQYGERDRFRVSGVEDDPDLVVSRDDTTIGLTYDRPLTRTIESLIDALS